MNSAAENRINVSRGQILFQPGQDCGGFVVVHQGTVRVSLTAPNGREIVLYRVRRGDVCLQTFSALVHGTPYTAEGLAETDLVIEILPPHAFQARVVEDDAALLASLMPAGYKARPEQVVLFTIAAWDTNCPQHIPQKFDAADVAAALSWSEARIKDLEAELARLKGQPDPSA